MEKPNLELLSSLAYGYYPTGIDQYEDGYSSTKENLLLTEAVKLGKKKNAEWESFMRLLGQLGLEYEDVSFFSLERCFSCRFFKINQYAEYSVVCLSFLIPSFFFYHNCESTNEFRAELDISPGMADLKVKIIANMKRHFGDVYEFPYEYASIELPEVGYGNKGIITRNGRANGTSPMTLFNAFFSDMFIFG